MSSMRHEIGEPAARLHSFAKDLDNPDAGELTFRFELRDDRLHQLGDGTYGMVFPAVDGGILPGQRPNRLYAVKVIYRHQVPQRSTSADEVATISRLREELRIGKKLTTALGETRAIWAEQLRRMPEGSDRDLSVAAFIDFEGITKTNWIGRYLVLPEAATEKFEDFGDVELADRSLAFSGFAYVMERCDASLKDLVEADQPDSETDDPQRSMSGQFHPAHHPEDREQQAIGGAYSRLKREPLLYRAYEALTVGIELARGLQVLHAAGYRHHDIKPANIYFTSAGDERHFKLGDLGFLQTIEARGVQSTTKSLRAESGGTVHFRSPEQRHGQDAAECAVQWFASDDVVGATLITRDPKFRGTRISRGDFAFLAKDGEQSLMEVDRVRSDPQSGVTVIEVYHHNVVDRTSLVNSTRTQVGFIKRSSVRTDLFGLGAVMYDLITAGQSPERFHDRLWPYDREEIRLQDDVLELYQTWIHGGISDPTISDLFASLHGESEPSEPLPDLVVKILLNLMASNAADSYHQQYGFEDVHAPEDRGWRAANAWYLVIGELELAKAQIEEALGGEVNDAKILRPPGHPSGAGTTSTPGGERTKGRRSALSSLPARQ